MQRKSSKKQRTKELTKARKYIYTVLFFITALSLCYGIIFNHQLIPDSLVGIIAFAFLLYFDKKHKLSTIIVLLISMPVFLNLAGVLGLYSTFVIGHLGYDKVLHFANSFAGVYIFARLLTQKSKASRLAVAVLMMMGIGAIGEISEFIGARYFGQNTGGIFAQGDGLPAVNDLIKYDTYFDMIFDLGGSLSCAVLMAFVLKKKSSKGH